MCMQQEKVKQAMAKSKGKISKSAQLGMVEALEIVGIQCSTQMKRKHAQSSQEVMQRWRLTNERNQNG